MPSSRHSSDTNVSRWAILADYAVWSEIRHEHLAEMRRLYGFRSFAGGAARELGDRLREEAPRTQSNEDLVRRFVEVLSERVKSGHLWTPQIRPFRRPETGVEFYFTASCVCKVVWILVRQLRGPHFSTCA